MFNLEVLGDRDDELGVHGLDVAAHLVQRVLVVERRVQDGRAGCGGAQVAVELVLFAAQVGADGGHDRTGRQLEDLAGERGVGLGQGGAAAVQHDALGRGAVDQVDRCLALLFARHQERIDDAGAQRIGQRHGVVIARAQGRFGFAEGARAPTR
jgi:hypothetical protein